MPAWLLLGVALLHTLFLILILVAGKPEGARRWLVLLMCWLAGWAGSRAGWALLPTPTDRAALLVCTYLCLFGAGLTLTYLGTRLAPQRATAWPTALMGLLAALWLVAVRFPASLHVAALLPFPPLSPVAGSHLLGLWLVSCGVVAAGLFWRQLHRGAGLLRLQVQYLLLGTCGWLLGATLDTLFPGVHRGWPLPGVTPLLAVLLSVTIWYAWSRLRLRAPATVLTTGVVTLLTLAGATLLFGLSVAGVDRLIWTYTRMPQRAGSFLLALLFGLALHPLWQGVYQLLAWSGARKPDHRQALHDLSGICTRCRDLDLLISATADILLRALHPEHLAVLLPAADGMLLPHPGAPYWEGLPNALPAAMLVPEAVRTQGDVVLCDELLRAPAPLRQLGVELQAWGGALLLPLCLEGNIHGVIVLGERAAGDAYTVEDVQFLQVAARQMTLALENARQYAELRTLNADLDAQVHARTQELHTALVALQDADRAKDTFLAMVSHELLTPVTSLLGWTEIAERHPADIPRALKAITQSAERQHRLVKDLLDVTRIIHGKLSLQPEPTDLWEVTLACLESMRVQAEERRLTLAVIPPACSLPLVADPVRLQQVVTNLGANAVKFTPPHGTITVTGSSTEAEGQLLIRDTGCGIPPEDLPHVFELFRQGGQKTASRGLGLGLTIVHGIVTAHGGQLAIDSPGRGGGCTVTLRLPLAGAERSAPVETVVSGAGRA